MQIPRKVCRTGPPNYCSSTECVWPKIFGNDLLHTHVEFYHKEFKGHEYISLEIKIIMSTSKFLHF